MSELMPLISAALTDAANKPVQGCSNFAQGVVHFLAVRGLRIVSVHAPVPPLDEAREREAFEAAHPRINTIRGLRFGSYRNVDVERRWQTWRAAKLHARGEG